MSRTKEFYHDVINAHPVEDLVDDAYFFERWKEQQAKMTASRLQEEWENGQEFMQEFNEACEQLDHEYNGIQRDIEESELPSFMHPRL
jgi:predicted RNase H-like nuclease (RuvC/YqgF family)